MARGIGDMAQGMKLANVVERLSDFDDEDTIYAQEPWCEESLAMVAREPEAGGVPLEAAQAGMKYFIEIHIAKQFIEDWVSLLQEVPTLSSTCRRLIEYAIHDS
jgi:hypothetical protein